MSAVTATRYTSTQWPRSRAGNPSASISSRDRSVGSAKPRGRFPRPRRQGSRSASAGISRPRGSLPGTRGSGAASIAERVRSPWTQWAHRYDHVDPKTGLPLWDDNLKGRGVRGTTPWTRFQIELPVAAGATRIVFGGLLAGNGTAWFDDLAVDVDGKPLAETLAALPMPQPSADLNLDFEVDEPKFETPKGWFVSGRGSPIGGGGKGYELELDATTAKSGRQSLRLRSTGKGRAGRIRRLHSEHPGLRGCRKACSC